MPRSGKWGVLCLIGCAAAFGQPDPRGIYVYSEHLAQDAPLVAIARTPVLSLDGIGSNPPGPLVIPVQH